MSWTFETIAGPYQGAAAGLAWDGARMLFSLPDEARVMQFDPAAGMTTEFRPYTYRINGLGFGPAGELYACQESGRRIIQFQRDGSATPIHNLLEGRMCNQPCDLVVDRAGRIWYADAHNPIQTPGHQMYPYLEHASVLRLQRGERKAWQITRMTFDTTAPRALLLSLDESTLYVADGEPGRSPVRELRAYAVDAAGNLDAGIVLHTFGTDRRGAHRGVEGMCLDSEGNIVACGGWKRSGPGPLIYVFSPAGAILETHALPGDQPMRCAFGDADLASLYVTTAEGLVYRARTGGRRGARVHRAAGSEPE